MLNMNPWGMIGNLAFLGAIYAAAAYLIGSIPTGYLIVKAKTGKDIREVGSGSTGATNVKRALPVVMAKFLAPEFPICAVIAAIFVIIGHSKPIFLGGKGGKSVASGVGTILALNWQVGLILAVVWSIITYFTRYVSVGSIIALILSPFLMYFFKAPLSYIIYCVIAAVYVTYLHRENIKRLMKGEENKVR